MPEQRLLLISAWLLYYYIALFHQVLNPMPRLLKLLCYGLMCLPLNLLAQDDLRIATSIKPLQLITNQVLGSSGKAELLIDSNQSPHRFQLKPSQLKRMTDADLLIWISDDFETGLRKLQSILPPQAHRLQLIEQLPASALIGDDHNVDGHIWLSVENVALIAQSIARSLARLSPAHASDYQANVQQLIQQLKQWKARQVFSITHS